MSNKAKLEELRAKIIENMNGKCLATDSIGMIFVKFLLHIFIMIVGIFTSFFQGLWTFLKYAYYKFVIWAEKEDDSEGEEAA